MDLLSDAGALRAALIGRPYRGLRRLAARDDKQLRRIKSLATATMLVAVALALTAGTAWAEGHFCRWWQYDTYYGGYWLYLDCPADVEDGRYAGWYSEIPWQSANDAQFLEPYYYQ